MKNEKYRLTLSNIDVNTTGHDGGHKYIVSTFDFNKHNRRISILLTDKNDEAKLEKGLSLTLEGTLQEDSNKDLLMLDAVIIKIDNPN